jgi:hypothetical protein
MITYKIIRAEAGSKMVSIRYSKDGKPDYFVRAQADNNWTEENIHLVAQESPNVDQAARYWAEQDDTPDIELSTDSGQVKDRVFEATPAFDPDIQRLVQNVTETETTITYSYSVVDLSEEQIASRIRIQRDQLLASTDPEMLPDRTPSDEMVTYRQALRDLPQQAGFPMDIQWPTRPID